MASRFPDFQHLGPEERVRMWQELWSWIFLVLNLGAVDLALRRDSNWASTATSTITGNLKTWVSARPSVQTLATLHQKWTTSCASWLLSVHLDLLTTFLVLFHQPTDLVPGFCPWWFLTAEEDTIPVDHCDPRGIQPSWCSLHFHSCPVPPRFSTALYSEVKLFKSSSWSYFITTKAQFVPWVCISFLQLKPSETHNKFGPEDF